MGAMHLSAFSKIPDVEIAAICTRDPRALAGDLSHIGGNIQKHAAVYDFSRARKYIEWHELAGDPELDAVDICLPTDLHPEVAIAALSANKHVLCEKPMALTIPDCHRMIAASGIHHRILMIGQVLRFWPEYVYLYNFVESQEYGAILSATFVRRCGLPDWSRWLPVEERSGGAVLDLLIHDIDQAIHLFGMPERVAAKKLGDIDALSATLIYPNGPEVRIHGGWFPPGTPLSMSFQVRARQAELELTPDGLMLSNQSGRRNRVETAQGDGYDAEIDYFVGCCRIGKEPERCMPQESARAVQVALLLKQSRAAGGDQLKCLV